MDWSKFEPTDFEYDFENDELQRIGLLLKKQSSVFTIVGDRRFEPDCALYAGCGYIRESDKKKPGGRRPPTPA